MGFRRRKSRLTREQILSALGLEEEPSARARALETVGAFSLGVVVGAATALLLAPMTGAELRRRIVELVRSRVTRRDEEISQADEARRAEAAI